MSCIFKKPDGNICGNQALKKSECCCLHDKNSISLFFKDNFLHYKKDEFVFGLLKKDGEKYIKSGLAVRVDNKLFKRFLKNNQK